MKKPSSNETLRAALEYAAKGYPVFPCNQNKIPCVGWTTEATVDEKTIRGWWKKFPKAMIGLPTGAPSGLFVIDLDVDKKTGEKIGEKTIKALGLDLSEGPCSHTPSGGLHFFFKWEPGLKNSVKAVGKGVDTRGEGGYVIAPCSHNGTDSYRWDEKSILDVEIAPIPKDFLRLLHQKSGAKSGFHGGRASNPNIKFDHKSAQKCLLSKIQKVAHAEEGERNNTLYSAAYKLGAYVSHGFLDPEYATTKLMESAEKCGLPFEEATATIEGGLQAGAEGAGENTARRSPEEGPQPLVRETPRGEDYPTHALGPLEGVVRAVHDKTQAPIAIAAQSALSVASLAVQGFANVATLGGDAPCSLFCITIAQSGERKTACDKLLMQGVREHEVAETTKYRDEYAKFETSKKIWETRRAQLLKSATGKKQAEAQEAKTELDDYPPQPEAPLLPSRTATEPTFEGLVKLFAAGHPSLGLFTDEGGGFVGGHAMNSDNRLKTCAGLSNLWDGTPVNRTRAGDGASTLCGRRLACHMMVQPVVARPMLADPVASGQGFLARFLLCEPESTIGSRLSRKARPQSDAAIADFTGIVRGFLRASLPLAEGSKNELEPKTIKLSKGAEEILIKFYNETEVAQRPDGGMARIRPYASKSAEQAARIAGVLTLWENKDEDMVAAETMENTVALSRYYLSEALRLADAAVISEITEQAEMLRLWILDHWAKHYILLSDIVQFGPASLRDSSRVKPLLEILVESGWLVQLPVGSKVEGKRRKKAYEIVRVEA